jgi:hypothetical protein
MHRGLADVLAVHRPVADTVEVRSGERAGLARQRAERGDDLPRLGRSREQLESRAILPERDDETPQLVGGAERIRVRAPQQAEQLVGRAPRPLARVDEEVADREQSRHVEEVVQVRALDLVVTAAIEVGEQLARIERVRVDRQQLEMRASGGRLHLAVPALEVLPPQLPL